MKAKNLSPADGNPTKTEYAIISAVVIIFAFTTYELFWGAPGEERIDDGHRAAATLVPRNDGNNCRGRVRQVRSSLRGCRSG